MNENTVNYPKAQKIRHLDQLLDKIDEFEELIQDVKDAKTTELQHDYVSIRIHRCTDYDNPYTWQFRITNEKHLQMILDSLINEYTIKRKELIEEFEKRYNK